MKIVRPQRRTARTAGVSLAEVTVASAVQPGVRETVAVGRRLDVLATEHAKGFITEAQYLVGRMIEAVFLRALGRGGLGEWGEARSACPGVGRELAMILMLDDAERVRKFTARLQEAIGAVGVRFLRAILAEGETFGGYAARTGKGSGERAATDVAKRFRWLLEALVDEQHTATGAEGQRIRAERD